MALAHRGQPVGLVLDRVVLGADPEEPAVEQPDRTGENPVPGDRPLPEIPLHPVAQLRQRVREVEHVLELLPVPALAPAVVVAVLLAAASIHAGRLDVAEGVGADPDLLPGGWDRERPDAREKLPVLDPLAGALVDVVESAS